MPRRRALKRQQYRRSLWVRLMARLWLASMRIRIARLLLWLLKTLKL
jgi:hypothetical protein